MVLIIGGAFQGKLEYAVNRFSLSTEDVADGAECSLEEALRARCLRDLHLFSGRFSLGDIEYWLENNVCEIVIADEIGGGIVPAGEDMRKLRETAGRLMCRAAEKADAVIRVHCGIPAVIKGAI